jgi:formylglycine-generating enzyme required for sulfatase activity
MVYIPAGWFTMGSNHGDSDEKPVHQVYLDAFYISKYEITNSQYCVFLNEVGNQSEGGATWLDINDSDCKILYKDGKYVPKKGYEKHPVVEVSWYGARAYCQWAGGRLPTEAEWEKAARGGLEGKKYPWGDIIDSSKANYNNNVGDTTKVGSYPPNNYGLYDMAGNVWEWCNDWYDSNYYNNSPTNNPQGPSSGTYRVIRGGGFCNVANYCRCAFRYSGSPRNSGTILGFRLIKDY